ncbi:MAG: twin-arginine translocase TatA/TatE family subunit [Burkholderiaceae bacterium]|nr:twin-arginine translocase TatA/TatE family subunit [Microbacteriaceae bacterium]
MFQNLTGWHALVILVVVVLLFGAAKLPALAKSVGQSMKIFKSEMKSGAAEDEVPAPQPGAQTAPPTGTAPASPQAGSTETHLKP